MAKKAPKASKQKTLTLRVPPDDHQLFERAAKVEHFDSLAQWMKVHLRAAASHAIRVAERETSAK